MIFENGDLRYIRYGAVEMVRRIYAAARDAHWGTAPNALSQLQMNVDEDAFDISYTCENRMAEMDFVWQGRIIGKPSGSISFVFDGVARSTFTRARLGFCVLHPAALAGTHALIEKVEGAIVSATFPTRIAPQRVVDGIIKPVAPFDEMRALTCVISPQTSLRIAFAGDIFEMEDQRNWTDGSFKTYCTPLRLPFPVEVLAGTHIRQEITLEFQQASRSVTFEVPARKPGVQIALLKTKHYLPELGLCHAPAGLTLNKKQAARLSALKLAHVRAEVPLYEAEWKARLKRAAREAAKLGAKLELAVFVSDDASAELARFAALASQLKIDVARYLVHHRNETTTSLQWLAMARQLLGKHAPIYSGTNKFFTELNRNKPNNDTLAVLNGLCYSFNPQVHAFDNTSIAETPEAQAETVRTCQTFAKGKLIAISPITLKPRFSLGDCGPEPREKWAEHDLRQQSLFGAAWTLASLKHLAQTDGVSSLTMFETTGKRGVLAGATVFPLYHVFASVAEFGGSVVGSKSSDSLRVESLALRNGDRMRLLLANMTDQPQLAQVKISAKKVSLKRLNAQNAAQARKNPEAFRSALGEKSALIGELLIELAPSEIVEMDW
jgi:hypothetical protein